MNTYILKVPSSQRAEDWFKFVNESIQNTDDIDSLVVDFNDVRFMETDDSF
ncbi:hypothetical protein ACFQZJ_19255 [Maribacter chungangensis]|uniref:PH domain-containing protein n=1 Tax=Maribacter chungangensis TaxID=1069117 RepID=A0ABW3B8E2_9FLAO